MPSVRRVPCSPPAGPPHLKVPVVSAVLRHCHRLSPRHRCQHLVCSGCHARGRRARRRRAAAAAAPAVAAGCHVRQARPKGGRLPALLHQRGRRRRRLILVQLRRKALGSCQEGLGAGGALPDGQRGGALQQERATGVQQGRGAGGGSPGGAAAGRQAAGRLCDQILRRRVRLRRYPVQPPGVACVPPLLPLQQLQRGGKGESRLSSCGCSQGAAVVLLLMLRRATVFSSSRAPCFPNTQRERVCGNTTTPCSACTAHACFPRPDAPPGR